MSILSMYLPFSVGRGGGLSNEMCTDYLLFVNYLWVGLMAERTGKCYLSCKVFTVFFLLFLFVPSAGGLCILSAPQAPFPFLSISKNWCFQYSFFPSVILPCICTVFKESFVYVFAIKKKKLLKKRLLSCIPRAKTQGKIQLCNISALYYGQQRSTFQHIALLVFSTRLSQWKG